MRPVLRGLPQAWAIHGGGARPVYLRRLRTGGGTAFSRVDGNCAGTSGSPVEALADELRLRPMPPTHEPGSIERVYYVYGKSAQSGIEKYARVPDSVPLFDRGLSMAAPQCVWSAGTPRLPGYDGEHWAAPYREPAGGTHRNCEPGASRAGGSRAHLHPGSRQGLGASIICALWSSAKSSVPASKR